MVVVGGLCSNGGLKASKYQEHLVLTLEGSFLSTHFFSMSAVPITWC